jgi:hypothetical protein
MKKWIFGAAALGASLLSTNPASAALTYKNPGDTSAYVTDWAVGSAYTNFAFLTSTGTFVGSWEVDQGPSWTTVPTAYSGQGAAALLFGGSAGDYTISSLDNIFADADHLSWVSTYGGACGGTFPCGTKVAEDFVKGTSSGPATPEPAAWALLIVGFGAVGGVMRRQRIVAVRYA